MIVEFIGTPGAGKTTLLPTAAQYLRERGFETYTVVEASRVFAKRTTIGKAVNSLAPAFLGGPLMWQVFYRYSRSHRRRFENKEPDLFRQVDDWQKQRPASADADQRRALYWFDRTAGYYAFLSAHIQENEAVLFDEGFVHRVVQLFTSPEEKPEPSRILAYADLVPRSDLVIHAAAPTDVCLRRIHKRGLWKHYGHKNETEIAQFISHACQAVTLMVGRLKSLGWTVIEVDNSGNDPDHAREELRARMADLWLPSGQAKVAPALVQQVEAS